MPELDLQKNTSEKVGIVYGNKNLIYNFPSEESDTEAWDLINFFPKKPPEMYKVIYFLTAVSQEGREALVRPWSKKEDPFTQTDLLDSKEDQAQELIFRFRASRSIPYLESLANRLLTLFDDAKEEDPASLGIEAGSLRNFYNFLQLNAKLKCPTISLTPENNIYASWRDEQNRVFSVHFLSNGDVRFVIFKPNNRHPERQIRLSGIATTDTLMETVTPNGLWDWIAE